MCLSFADVFDVVRDAKDRVFLLDFSPFNEKYSESLAFEWTDLMEDDEVHSNISIKFIENVKKYFSDLLCIIL